MNQQILLLLGVPGSGKGTQAKKLKEHCGFAHISSGDLLRALDADPNGDPEQKKMLADMKAGRLVSNDLIYTLVFAEIEKQVALGKNIVLDGVTRTVEQAKAFDNFFAEKGLLDTVKVIEFTMSDDTSFKRLTKRKICSSCGYIIPYSPDNELKTVCEKCGGQLVVRADDAPEAIEKRIREQGNVGVAPIREYYKSRGNYIAIDAEQDIAGMETDLMQVLQLA